MSKKISNLLSCLGLMLFAAVQTYATDILKDDFSNELTSNNGWKTSNDFITRTFGGGACTVSDTSSEYSGFVYHAISNQPTTFTVSCKISRATPDIMIGLGVCMNSSNGDGYQIYLGPNAIFVYKPGQTQAPEITSSYINLLENVLKVSKSGNTFNVFVNDHFIYSFEDSQAQKGDIAFWVNPKTTAVFDDFLMTDQFTQGGLPTSFSDDFQDGNLVGWNVADSNTTVTPENGVLHLVSGDSGRAFVMTKVKLDNFKLSVLVTHKDGDKESSYGLYLQGDDPKTQFATFAINGNSKFGAVVGNAKYTLTPSDKINGDAYTSSTGTVYYVADTLEVVKRSGSNEYIFIANRDTLQRLTGINFNITSAGIFCQDKVNLEFDNFSANDFSTSVIHNNHVNHPRAITMNFRQAGTYDILGRLICGKGHASYLNRNISSGLYIQRNSQRAAAKLMKP